MMEQYIEKSYELLKIHNRISPALLMRNFKINSKLASEICNKVWKNMHLEARKLAKDIESF